MGAAIGPRACGPPRSDFRATHRGSSPACCYPQVAQLPLFVSDGKWHHICVTWTTRDGMWEAFQDGEKLGTGENLAPWHPIKPGGVLILGQEQVGTGEPQVSVLGPHEQHGEGLQATRALLSCLPGGCDCCGMMVAWMDEVPPALLTLSVP